MHHIHITKYEKGRQVCTSLYGFGGIPRVIKNANGARKEAAELHAIFNRYAPAGIRYAVEATGTPEWWLAVDERIGSLPIRCGINLTKWEE